MIILVRLVILNIYTYRIEKASFYQLHMILVYY